MGLLKDQAVRLLRNAWRTPQALAEELWSILNSDTGTVIDGPVTINNRSDQSPLTINQFGGGDLGITIVRRQDPAAPQYPGSVDLGGGTLGQLPSYNPFEPTDLQPGTRTTLNIPASGDITVVTSASDDPPGALRPGQPDPAATRPPLGGGGIPGVVLSGGPGDTYSVRVYPNGLAAASQDVTVTQLQIADDATIQAGTWTVVAQAGSAYYMQVPVWGE